MRLTLGQSLLLIALLAIVGLPLLKDCGAPHPHGGNAVVVDSSRGTTNPSPSRAPKPREVPAPQAPAPVPPNTGASPQIPEADRLLQNAYNNRQGNFQVQGSGVVTNVLSDDAEGSRHQRFILRLSTGQTLLIAHNIDLAPRVAGLNTGHVVEFFGEYEWNEKGGVIHWTHHDPNGRHVAGWLYHNGTIYQ